jgi:hypothetical protein
MTVSPKAIYIFNVFFINIPVTFFKEVEKNKIYMEIHTHHWRYTRVTLQDVGISNDSK